MTAPWQSQGHTADTAGIHLGVDEYGEDVYVSEPGGKHDAETWGHRGPSASYAKGQPEAGS